MMDNQSSLARDIGIAAAKFSPVGGFIAAKLSGLDMQAIAAGASIAANVTAAIYATTQLVLIIRKHFWKKAP